MSGSIYGKIFQISTWGESHGKALGVVIDGCPSGIPLCKKDIQKELDRRKPGASAYSTKRNESDEVEILSGVFEGVTTGTPISLAVFNKDQRSKDYTQISSVFRPGHADYTFYEKYGIRDYRGGGRSSGRETLCRVAAGAVAKKTLSSIGIDVTAYTYSIGEVAIDKNNFNKDEINKNEVLMPDKYAAEKASEFLDKCISEGDSAGGIIQCEITGVPVGIGETVFDKLDAEISKAVFSIGAVKGVEFGIGFDAAKIKGSQNNDSFCTDENGMVKKHTNNSGGVLGGMSDGSPIIFRVALKPTPSISKLQKTVTTDGENVNISIHGRHDPVVVPRAVVVVESMAAVALVDLLFQNMYSKIDSVKKFYNK